MNSTDFRLPIGHICTTKAHNPEEGPVAAALEAQPQCGQKKMDRGWIQIRLDPYLSVCRGFFASPSMKLAEYGSRMESIVDPSVVRGRKKDGSIRQSNRNSNNEWFTIEETILVYVRKRMAPRTDGLIAIGRDSLRWLGQR